MKTPLSIKNTTKYIKGHSGDYKLFYQEFHPEGVEVKASLILTHGLGEHSDAYRDFCFKICSELPIQVITWDLYGHGRSDGTRGHVGDIKWHLHDLQSVIQQNSLSSQVFIFGHSLGGLITLAAEQEGLLKEIKSRALILSNPATGIAFTPPRWKTAGAEILVKLAPKMTLDSGLKPEQLSHLESHIEDFKKDALRHTKISSRQYLGMLELMKNITSMTLQVPCLALLSNQDPICSYATNLKFFKDSAQLVSFQNSLHEVLNDQEQDIAFKKIMEFINENKNS